ncbi:diguanylate cyclase [Aquincola sp. S2]|uniref:Diguanylate cyclase n=2 Tax=Pseudaquabacterium terrae TaxID=2732868 RepID=A0ABX2EGT0_9BURK|nr:diguanylate cyclase [Aquabacterium terrae]
MALAIVIASLSYSAGTKAVDTVAEHLLRETAGRIAQAVERHVVGSRAVLEAAFPEGMPVASDIEKEIPALRSRFWIATSMHLDPNNYAYYGNRAGQFFGIWRNSRSEAELRLKLNAGASRVVSRFTGIDGALHEPAAEARLFEPRERPWYAAGLAGGAHAWTPIYVDFRTEELVLTRARRVLGTDGALEGVVATDVSLRGLSAFVRQLQLAPNGFAFIVEPDGNLVAASNTASLAPNSDGVRTRLKLLDAGNVELCAVYRALLPMLDGIRPNQPATVVRVAGAQVVDAALARFTDDAGLDWFIGVAAPRSDFTQGVTENVRRTVALGLIAAVLVVVTGMSILAWVARDLRRLSVAAMRAGEGDLQADVGIDRADEIGDLARSLVAMQDKLRTDRLTGLVNREALLNRIRKRIEMHRRADDMPFAVLFVDLNRFKEINDRFGHDVGDRVLVVAGMRLLHRMRDSDVVARYAGDEFAVLLDHVDSRDTAERVRQKAELALGDPLEGEEIAGLADLPRLGGAVGVAMFPADGRNAEELIQRADADMYARKPGSREAGLSWPAGGQAVDPVNASG